MTSCRVASTKNSNPTPAPVPHAHQRFPAATARTSPTARENGNGPQGNPASTYSAVTAPMPATMGPGALRRNSSKAGPASNRATACHVRAVPKRCAAKNVPTTCTDATNTLRTASGGRRRLVMVREYARAPRAIIGHRV